MKKKSKARKIIKLTALSLAGILLASVLTVGIILYGRAATILSVKQAGNQLYTVNFQQNYHLDKALSANIKSEESCCNSSATNSISAIRWKTTSRNSRAARF